MRTRRYAIPAPSRQRRSAQTRAAILAAAERIFAQVGLAGARTDAIAAAAGVNKALLYYYFKSKEAIYCAIVEDHLKEFRTRALHVLSSPGSSRSVLLRYVAAHFDFVSARPYYPQLVQRMMMAGGRMLQRLAQSHFIPVYRKLRQVIGRGVRGGEFRAVEDHHTIISIVALTVFYFSAAPMMRAVVGADAYAPANLARRKEEVLRFVRYGLFRHPEERIS